MSSLLSNNTSQQLPNTLDSPNVIPSHIFPKEYQNTVLMQTEGGFNINGFVNPISIQTQPMSMAANSPLREHPTVTSELHVEHSLVRGVVQGQAVSNDNETNCNWHNQGAYYQQPTINNDAPVGRPRSGSLPELKLIFLDNPSLHQEQSLFFKEV
jgi:hypothetical protein